MNFNTYISMLAQQIMMLLGRMPNPITGESEKNIEGAKAFIDILVMLEAKTKGNLTKEEETFLQSTLTNLQMAYVQETSKK